MENIINESATGSKKNKNTSGEGLHNSSEWSDICDESSLLQLLDEPFDINLDSSRLRTDEKYCGFDNNVGSTWIYPTNLPIRSYQFNITKLSLYHNTLVVLPTGLGKTFIAAVVMYNIYRWYPTGKLIFMAPTRPLVAQQIESCRQIMGIPMKDTAEMTGRLNKNVRRDLWKTKRVFFVTPQIVQSDINDNEQEFPFNDIKLVVVDEAHKAKGRYAYTEVIQTISSRNLHFRILALSATPGRSIEDVAEVVRNLLISRIEVRWENSIDVLPYTHKKNIKIVAVPLDHELMRIRDELIEIIDPYVRNLIDGGVISGSTNSMSRGWLIMEQKRFRAMSMHQKHPNHSSITTDFSICVSLYYALELLERHGVWVFLNSFADETNSKEEKFFVSMNSALKKLLDNLRNHVGPNPFLSQAQTMTNGNIATIPENFDFGHPKFTIAKQHILNHFEKHIESKVIVFCEYRDTALLLYKLLLQNRPIIKPRAFVGQGGTGSLRAISQKQQIQIMSDFRSGVSNTLIATSVAEEGIDVGEVDLIICFDSSSKNPTRFIQRIGRTGRRRQGHVIMLGTEGKEHSLIKEVLATKDKINQKIVRNKEILNILYKKPTRLVPPEFDPKCVETLMQIKDDIEESKPTKKGKIKPIKTDTVNDKSKKSGKGRKTKVKELLSGTKDVRNFFKKIEFDKEDLDVFSLSKDFSFSIPQTIKDISLGSSMLTQKSISSPKMDTLDSFEVQAENNFTIDMKTKSPNDKFNEAGMVGLRRKIATFTRNLEIKSKEGLVENLSDLINLKNVDNRMKRFLLENHYDYIQEKYDAIVALEVVINNENNGVFEKEVSSLKNAFTKIEQIFGSREELTSFLTNRKLKALNEDTDLDRKFGDMFVGFTKRKLTDNVDDFINKRLAQFKEDSSSEDDDDDDGLNEMCDFRERSIVYDDVVPEKDQSISMLDDESVNDCIMNEVDSKYLSQFTQFNKDNIKNQSTPLRKQQIVGNRFEKSPLIKAFNKSVEKSSMKDTSTRSPIKFMSPIEEKSNGIKKYFQNVSTELSNPLQKDDVDDNLLDDDFDAVLFQNSHILTQIDQKPKKCLGNPFAIDSCNIEDPDMVSLEDIIKIVEAKEKELLENRIRRSQSPVQLDKDEISQIEDFDVSEFYETFEYNDELDRNISPESFKQNSNDNKENKLVNLFEYTNNLQIPNITNNNKTDVQINNYSIHLSNKSSEELFGSSSPLSKKMFLPTIKEVKGNTSPDIHFSPKKSLLSKPCEETTSPSILSGRPNLKALRNSLNGGTGSKRHHKTSPILSKCNLEKKIISNENRFKNFAFNRSNYENTSIDDHTINESVIGGKHFVQRNKRAIESSDSDEEISATCKKVTDTHRRKIRHRKKKRIKFNDFIDSEAIGSNDDDDDEDEDDFVSQFQLDSVFVDEDDIEDHPSVNMQAKYLESVKSPIKAPGAFKIPARREYMDLSNIFSQPVPLEGNSVYKEDSFVVTDDDDNEDDEEKEHSNDDNSQMCPLERAEAILKARRKAKKRKLNDNGFEKIENKYKKRIINRLDISSD